MSRILIIEDENSIAELEKDYLELAGFEVEICGDGTQGLKEALAEDIDLLILQLLYHPDIKCGMNASACEEVIRSLYY